MHKSFHLTFKNRYQLGPLELAGKADGKELQVSIQLFRSVTPKYHLMHGIGEICLGKDTDHLISHLLRIGSYEQIFQNFVCF